MSRQSNFECLRYTAILVRHRADSRVHMRRFHSLQLSRYMTQEVHDRQNDKAGCHIFLLKLLGSSRIDNWFARKKVSRQI